MDLETITRFFLSENPVNIIFATLLISSVPFLINQHDMEERYQDVVEAFSSYKTLLNKNHQTFDYIIVGSGSGGSVMANRLSRNNKVLLLEVGGSPSPVSEIPFFQPNLLGTKMDYSYKTEPQKNMGFAFKDQVQVIPRAKLLGGSGQINAMMYVRGNKLDYKTWAELVGDSSFSYENVLKAYKKQEDYHGSYPNPKYHATGGELYMTRNPYIPKIGKYLYEALAEKNIPLGDYNGDIPGPIFGVPDVLIKNGKRWGGYEAFLKPILSRQNLTIYKFSQASKIILDPSGKAIGVEYIRHGLKFKAYANKEVIICAGVFESPKLLMLSGIGDPKALKEAGINPLIDLPGVGKNYLEVPIVNLYIPTNEGFTFVNNRDLSPDDLQEYKTKGTGPFASSTFRPAVGYTSTSNNTPKVYPDIWNIIEAVGIPTKLDSSHGPKFSEYLKEYQGKDGLVILIFHYKPKSVPGEIRARSNKPNDPPIIDPNYFNNPEDVESYVDAINVVVDLIETTKAFASTGAHIIQKKFPGCEDFVLKSREYWKCYIRQTGTTGIQSVGSCKMGRDNDPTAVVDSDFRVFKTKNLRIVDASVIPFYLTGNPHAEVMMMAEIGSAKILGNQIM